MMLAAAPATSRSPATNSLTSKPRERHFVIAPRRLVTAANRPVVDIASQLPPWLRSRPPTIRGSSRHTCAVSDGRVKSSSRFAAITSGKAGDALMAMAIRHIHEGRTVTGDRLPVTSGVAACDPPPRSAVTRHPSATETALPRPTAQLLQPLIAPAVEAVELVPDRILLVVVLVIPL